MGKKQRSDSRNRNAKASDPTASGRRQAVRVKTAAKRSLSSALWLARQLNDPYVVEARRAGYRSRAAFKLIQLDEKFRFLKPGARIVDLGAAPGGWTQIAVERSGAKEGRGRVVALDILPMEPIAGASTLLCDFLAADAASRLKAELAGLADIVLSDMAAPTTGHSRTDHLRIVGLCQAAFDFAEEILAPGGCFIAKMFHGGADREVLDRLKRRFANLRHAKPPASRAESTEIYVVATGFRPAGA